MKAAYAYAAVTAVFVIAADQASKIAVLRALADGESVPVLPFFNLVLVWNRGVSFGLFNGGQPLPPYAFIAVSLLIAAGFAFWMSRQGGLLHALCTGLVVGGAIGNVIDRARLGAVVDFLDFYVGAWHWPAFNVADSAIVAGIALIVFDGIVLSPRQMGAQQHETGKAE